MSSRKNLLLTNWLDNVVNLLLTKWLDNVVNLLLTKWLDNVVNLLLTKWLDNLVNQTQLPCFVGTNVCTGEHHIERLIDWYLKTIIKIN